MLIKYDFAKLYHISMMSPKYIFVDSSISAVKTERKILDLEQALFF